MLTDAQCRSARPREKSYRLSDARGLYLEVSPTGYRAWRWKYTIDGREKRPSIPLAIPIGDLHHGLAEVPPCQQVKERRGNIVEAGHDMLAMPQLSGA